MSAAESARPHRSFTPALDHLLADLPMLAWQSGADPRRRHFATRWDFLASLDGERWLNQVDRAQRAEIELRLEQASRNKQHFSLQYEFVDAQMRQRVLDRGFASADGYYGLWIDLESPALNRRDLHERLHELSQPLTVALHWLQGSRRRIRKGHPADAADIEVALDRAMAELQRAVAMLSNWRGAR